MERNRLVDRKVGDLIKIDGYGTYRVIRAPHGWSQVYLDRENVEEVTLVLERVVDTAEVSVDEKIQRG